ncbi:MAG: lysophospholipid acyltransferase family protein [Thermoleophilia bacterium]
MRRLPFYVPSDPPLYKFARGLLSGALRLYHRYDVSGSGHLPASGPAIVVSNHPSDIDPIILGVAFDRTLHFMADAVQFRRGFVGRVIPHLGAFPLRKGQADREALRVALGLLAAGEVVALFPEGDMYADDTMHPFERGIGYLAAASGAPVVPAAITGSYAVSDGRWLGLPTIRLTVGEPVDLGGIEGRGHVACARRTSLVEAAVRELREQGELAEREEAARRREHAAEEWRWEPESTFLWGERGGADWCEWPGEAGLGEGDDGTEPEGEPAGI